MTNWRKSKVRVLLWNPLGKNPEYAQDVPAVIALGYAVHREVIPGKPPGSRWTITHVNTGKAVLQPFHTIATQREAKAAVERLHEIAPLLGSLPTEEGAMEALGSEGKAWRAITGRVVKKRSC